MRTVQIFPDTVSGGRAMVCVAFDDTPPERVTRELRRCLDSQGMETQGAGRLLKFYCPNPHVPPTRFALARMALHRSGFERHDDDFPDAESAAECWDCAE